MKKELITNADALPEGMNIYEAYHMILAITDHLGLCVVRIKDDPGGYARYEVMTRSEYVGEPARDPG